MVILKHRFYTFGFFFRFFYFFIPFTFTFTFIKPGGNMEGHMGHDMSEHAMMGHSMNEHSMAGHEMPEHDMPAMCSMNVTMTTILRSGNRKLNG
jgi:hypothetical protein